MKNPKKNDVSVLAPGIDLSMGDTFRNFQASINQTGALKGDSSLASDYTVKTAVNNAISAATANMATISALALKADTATVNSALSNKADIIVMNTAIGNAVNPIVAQQSANTANITTLQGNVSTLQTGATSTSTAMTTLQTGVTNNANSISALQTRILMDETLISNNNSAITSLGGTVSALQTSSSNLQVKSSYAIYASTISPSIGSTSSLLSFDLKKSDITNLYSSGNLTVPFTARLKMSLKLRISITATLAIAVGTVINFYLYYRSASTGTFSQVQILRTYKILAALALNATLIDDVIFPSIDLSGIGGGNTLPAGSQIQIQASQNTGGTITIDSTAGSNWLNWEVIPVTSILTKDEQETEETKDGI